MGTVTKDLVDPFDLVHDFFSPENNWNLKTDEEGKPILKNFGDIRNKAQEIAYNQMMNVGKMFSLKPLPMGIMTTGVASIGNRTIRSLINEFKMKSTLAGFGDYTVKDIAEKVLEFINGYYQPEFLEWKSKPYSELMIGGYGKQGPFPTIFRILVHKNKVEATFAEGALFGIAFGGQMQEIQRIVFGIDSSNRVKLLIQVGELFDKYRKILQEFLKERQVSVELPSFQDYKDDLYLFRDWDLDGFDADWGDFSEQNAIECVNFFVEIMIKSQQFSSRLPTVGGNVHIGLITQEEGFKFISREEYIHEGYSTIVEV
ncbi:MAG: hypothetical protein ABSH06_20480 [Thermodesulfobacteriota bacterium]